MIQQNTPEWLELRKKKIGASDAPIIMNESPYCTPYQLWLDKMDLEKRNVTTAMRFGHDMEPEARKRFEKSCMCAVEPTVLFHPKKNWMMASLDGLNETAKIAVEIKMANVEDHETAKSGLVPDKYKAQLQHQLEILFALYNIDHLFYSSNHRDDTAIVEVERDNAYIDKMLDQEEKFLYNMENFISPDLTGRDYIDIQDDELLKKARELSELLPVIKDMTSRKDQLRKDLIDAAQGQNMQGGGIKMTKVVSKGSIDYKAIPELLNVDLDMYRKSPIEKWIIK